MYETGDNFNDSFRVSLKLSEVELESTAVCDNIDRKVNATFTTVQQVITIRSLLQMIV